MQAGAVSEAMFARASPPADSVLTPIKREMTYYRPGADPLVTVHRTPTTDDVMAMVDADLGEMASRKELLQRCGEQVCMIEVLREKLHLVLSEQEALVSAFDGKIAVMEKAMSAQANTIKMLQAAQPHADAIRARSTADAAVQAGKDGENAPSPGLEPDALPFPDSRSPPRPPSFPPSRQRRHMNGDEKWAGEQGRDYSPISSLSSQCSSETAHESRIVPQPQEWWVEEVRSTLLRDASPQYTHHGSPRARELSAHYRKQGSASYRSQSKRFGNGKDLARLGVKPNANASLGEEHPKAPCLGDYVDVYRDRRGTYWETARKSDSYWNLPATGASTRGPAPLSIV